MKKFINQIMHHILIYGEDPDFNNIPWKKLDFIRGGNMFQIEVKYLGINFARIVSECLTKKELKDSNFNNSLQTFDICETHNYMDTNQCMIDAIEKTFNISDDEWDLSDFENIINEAWSFAKLCSFNWVLMSHLDDEWTILNKGSK
tara:strand:- start:128 stop:565 length:438 start_codon:yes stop_codon:yes gene_type:complete